LHLDPGLAFGTGTHPTTALCLEWLDTMALEGTLDGVEVLDVGCGSGILAIAALKLGATSATGTDIDPQALLASRDTAVRNPSSAPARRWKWLRRLQPMWLPQGVWHCREFLNVRRKTYWMLTMTRVWSWTTLRYAKAGYGSPAIGLLEPRVR